MVAFDLYFMRSGRSDDKMEGSALFINVDTPGFPIERVETSNQQPSNFWIEQ